MYRSQKDRKHRRTISLAAQWRKRYKHNIDVWHAETAATAPRDIERESMDDAHLMVIVHNSNDRRVKHRSMCVGSVNQLINRIWGMRYPQYTILMIPKWVDADHPYPRKKRKASTTQYTGKGTIIL